MQLYLLTNVKNGKSYVGMTTNTAAGRFRGHCISAEKGSTTALHAAIRKYGSESFELTILAETDSRAKLQMLEREKILELGTRAPGGYNLTSGGDGFDRKHTAESVEKMRQAQRQYRENETEEHRLEIGRRVAVGLATRGEYDRGGGGKRNVGRVRSEEFKLKVSDGVKRMIASLPPGEMARRGRLRGTKGEN